MVIPSLKGRGQVGKTAGKGLLEFGCLGGTVHPRRHPILASLHRWLGMVARAGSGYDTSLEGAGVCLNHLPVSIDLRMNSILLLCRALLCIDTQVVVWIAVDRHRLNWYMADPGKDHWKAVQWILRYLKGTADVGLLFKKDNNNKCRIVGYTYSNYAANRDKRKSMIGYVFTLSGRTVSWKAVLQYMVALSTTEAKYVAMAEAVYHERTKHINVRYHFIREVANEGIVQIEKVGTEDDPADIMTKPVTTNKFRHCLDLASICRMDDDEEGLEAIESLRRLCQDCRDKGHNKMLRCGSIQIAMATSRNCRGNSSC
ncbi:hypothetical protein CRG98_041185 [Punica granatum]|uniref:Reverse transcriptase Ty1/copia-type domain-containing protein n=1 Tax=Punica granatum TaxID=22663 RepID=A0A2I0I336_PUNGR|nr:hypothetical protein CRG98_041185 [Punica granatum]